MVMIFDLGEYINLYACWFIFGLIWSLFAAAAPVAVLLPVF
jgi:hypothetical protein